MKRERIESDFPRPSSAAGGAKTGVGFNDNHQRHLVRTFQHVDALCVKAEQTLESIGSRSAWQDGSDRLRPASRDFGRTES